MSHVDSGLGKMVGSGSDGFIPPTRLIREATEAFDVDGVAIVFQLTPGTEAPADMNLHFPGLRVLNLAENACRTMHNLCPLRGAKTRDALAWAQYLDEALDRFVPGADVLVVQHHWPVWNSAAQPARIADYVAGQRDLYRYLHDQTLRLMSHGLTPTEIAAELLLPNALSKQWFARGYYGAVAHNVQAIYAHYLGPFEGNPARLDPLPPVDAARKQVAYMGGADAVVARARTDFEAGEFRWVVQVLDAVVFAEPGHLAARALSADAMEQLGYQAESATWRNAYLLAARELRQGTRTGGPRNLAISPDVIAILPLGSFLDYLAIRVHGPKAQALDMRLDWVLEGAGGDEERRLTLTNGTLNHRPGRHHPAAAATVRTTRAELVAVSGGRSALATALAEGRLRVAGDTAVLRALIEVLDEFEPMFNVVEP
jgi:alkyl sulfatase BDS1-like metallo-beta-lactamase superfamily hydrolase